MQLSLPCFFFLEREMDLPTWEQKMMEEEEEKEEYFIYPRLSHQAYL